MRHWLSTKLYNLSKINASRQLRTLWKKKKTQLTIIHHQYETLKNDTFAKSSQTNMQKL